MATWLNRKSPYPWIIFLGMVLAWLAWRATMSGRPIADHTAMSLERVDYLRDISEPITPIQGYSWDDGGSMGLLFKDRKQVEKGVCLENDLDGNKNLAFGSLTPTRTGSIPVGGPEERAFLGLLQRWYRQDPEARGWLDRMERRSRSKDRSPLFSGGETETQRAKAFAVSMMRTLQKRN